MDARHFDTLVKALISPDSRRRVLALLTTLPVVGLLGILDRDAAAADGRRKRRKKRHKHGDGRRRGNGKHKKKKRCTPEPVAQTCAGRCGSVTNNCQQPVDCGSCDCNPSCGECFACQGAAGAPGTCVPQPAGTPCGDPATCQSGTLMPQGRCNGSGVCAPVSPVSCAPYVHCDGDACATTCSIDEDCVAESFCEQGVCAGDLPNGERCAHGGQCASSFCVEGVCCDSACAGACESCVTTNFVGTCKTETDGTTCGAGNRCCSGSCQACCDSDDCSGTTPICDDGTCVACSVDPSGCPDGTCCNASSGACAGSCPASDPICANSVCRPCAAGRPCPAGCCAPNGTCQTGDTNLACGVVGGTCSACAAEETCCGGACVNLQQDPLHCGECGNDCREDQHCEDGACCYGTTEAFQQALADPDGPAIIRLCAGTFTVPSGSAAFEITRPVRIIGAGDGDGGTLLAQGGQGWVVAVGTNVGSADAPVQLERMALAHGETGVWIDGGAHVEITNCTVRENTTVKASGVVNSGTLTMTRCQIRDNGPDIAVATYDGGGLYNSGQATLNACCVTGNRQGLGGGIYNSFFATLTLTDTRVIGNSAVRGGGLYRNPPGTVTIEGETVICDNSATDDFPNCRDVTNAACGADPCPGGCTG